MSIAMLLRDHKVDGKKPDFVRAMNFAGGSKITKGLFGSIPDNVIDELRIWGRNDVHGTQYFASCKLPKPPYFEKLAGGMLPSVVGRCHPEECYHRLWRSTGIQHVYCTDDAPYTVVHHLTGQARIEYHRFPSAHMLSGIAALGFQYDCREALVLVQKRCFTTTINYKKTKLYLVWMKSIRHPEVDGEEQVQEDMVAASMMKSYAASQELENSHEVFMRTGDSNYERAVIRVRAIGFYADPDTNETICVNFGHEDSAGGITDVMGKAQYVLSMGLASGGIDQIVKFQMERLAHILPDGREGGYFGTGPYSTEYKQDWGGSNSTQPVGRAGYSIF